MRLPPCSALNDMRMSIVNAVRLEVFKSSTSTLPLRTRNSLMARSMSAAPAAAPAAGGGGPGVAPIPSKFVRPSAPSVRWSAGLSSVSRLTTMRRANSASTSRSSSSAPTEHAVPLANPPGSASSNLRTASRTGGQIEIDTRSNRTSRARLFASWSRTICRGAGGRQQDGKRDPGEHDERQQRGHEPHPERGATGWGHRASP